VKKHQSRRLRKCNRAQAEPVLPVAWGEQVSQKWNEEDGMDYLGLAFLQSGPDVSNVGLWLFLSIGAVSLFVVFIPLVTFMENRRKEREAFYKAETLRRLTESSSEGAKTALAMMQAENRQERLKKREGMKIGGLINIGVGAGLMIFLRSLGGNGSPWLCGLIPGFIGVALLVYVFVLAAPVE
jgi:hypothetical protein